MHRSKNHESAMILALKNIYNGYKSQKQLIYWQQYINMLSTIRSMVFTKKDVRLIGRKALRHLVAFAECGLLEFKIPCKLKREELMQSPPHVVEVPEIFHPVLSC